MFVNYEPTGATRVVRIRLGLWPFRRSIYILQVQVHATGIVPDGGGGKDKVDRLFWVDGRLPETDF